MLGTIQQMQKVRNERERQNHKWGVQIHNPLAWLLILGEEVAEAAQEVTPKGGTTDHYTTEVVQCAAVAVAMLESEAIKAGGRPNSNWSESLADERGPQVTALFKAFGLVCRGILEDNQEQEAQGWEALHALGCSMGEAMKTMEAGD